MKKIVALFLAVIMLLSSAALAEGMTAGTYQASAPRVSRQHRFESYR